jgi:hypothetical protein
VYHLLWNAEHGHNFNIFRFFFMFCILIIFVMKSDLMHYSFLIYFIKQPLHFLAYLLPIIWRYSLYMYMCMYVCIYHHHHHHHQYSALRPVLAGTRAQSGDRYGSGTLHSRQVLRGSLILLSLAFRRSHFSPPDASTSPSTRALLVATVELWARMVR